MPSSSPFKIFRRRTEENQPAAHANLKFMPNVTNTSDVKSTKSEDPASAALAAKQHRRAQVRRAQIEHRQRKANYVKKLEQDVIDLRELIESTQVEANTIEHENESMKAALSTIEISLPSQTDFNNLPGVSQSMAISQTIPYKSRISVSFDKSVNASVLHIDPPFDTYISPSNSSSSPFATTPASSLAISPSSDASARQFEKAPAREKNIDFTNIAVNFILALEHPCRTHFHAHPSDPWGDPSNHELMASAFLYASTNAPSPSTANPPSWESSAPTLDTLYAMSLSLPKGDFEITPVQAWFLLAERFGVERVISKIEELKKGLGKLVKCVVFGAVMEEGAFIEVVEDVMGERMFQS